MSARPIYRWKGFWLGLFVACSLQWLWWDSLSHGTAAGVRGADWGCGILRQKGETVAIWSPKRIGHDPGWGWFNRVRLLPSEWARHTAEELRVEYPHLWVGMIPDGVVFFSYVVVWCAWLAWRVRVEKNRSASLAVSGSRS